MFSPRALRPRASGGEPVPPLSLGCRYRGPPRRSPWADGRIGAFAYAGHITRLIAGHVFARGEMEDTHEDLMRASRAMMHACESGSRVTIIDILRQHRLAAFEAASARDYVPHASQWYVNTALQAVHHGGGEGSSGDESEDESAEV